MEPFKLYILGTRGSFPVHRPEFQLFGGATSCYLFKRGSYALVVDCGSGLNDAEPLLRDCTQVDVILTHLHYDHIMGLLNFAVFPDGARRRFFGTFDQWSGEDSLKVFMSHPFWPFTPDFGELVNISSPDTVQLEEGLSVRFCPSYHPNGASIVRVNTPDGDVCMAFDYEHSGPFPMEMIQGCSILFYDTMYSEKDYPKHIGWGHSTPDKGCALAAQAGVKLLIATHHAPNRTDEMLLEAERRAQELFPQTRFARAGTHIILGEEVSGL